MRPIAGLILGLLPHELRVDIAKHDQIVELREDIKELIYLVVAFLKKNYKVKHQVVGSTFKCYVDASDSHCGIASSIK